VNTQRPEDPTPRQIGRVMYGHLHLVLGVVATCLLVILAASFFHNEVAWYGKLTLGVGILLLYGMSYSFWKKKNGS
jgi:hypothetical protein